MNSLISLRDLESEHAAMEADNSTKFKLYAVDKSDYKQTLVGSFTERQATVAAKKYADDHNLKITKKVELVRNYSDAEEAFRYTFHVTPKASSVAKGKRRTAGKKRPKKRSVRRLR